MKHTFAKPKKGGNRTLKAPPLPDILQLMDDAHSHYLDIDPALQAWVERHSLTLCREWQGEARFWYTSRGNECFQVAVDPPDAGAVRVRASGIETDEDAELSGEWVVPPNEIERALVAATRLIDLWSVRPRTVR